MKTVKIFSLVFFILLVSLPDCFSKNQVKTITYPNNLYKGLIGEAVGERKEGMYAVACVYRNRIKKGMPLGCVALKRKDLDLFVKKQGGKYEIMAKNILLDVFERNSPDVTKGATHYENVEAFGLPPWAKNMRVVTRIGSHTFFAEKK